MNEPKTAAVTKEDKFTEFVPFGSEDKVKLSVVMIQNMIAVKTKTGKTCSITDAVKFIAMCQARRLNPFEGDAFLIGYDAKDGPVFSLITAHQAFLKRAELNKEYDGMKSGIIVEQENSLHDLEGDFHTDDQTVVGGWATVFFKNRKQPMHKRVRLKRFQKSWGIWQDDPAGMICKCAEADALRSSFPTMLGGLYLREEQAPEQSPNAKTPIFTTPATVTVDSETVTTVTSPPAEPEPKEEGAPAAVEPTGISPSTAIREIRSKLSKEKLSEMKLLTVLEQMGVINPAKSLEEVFQADGAVIGTIVTNLNDLIKKMKEAV